MNDVDQALTELHERLRRHPRDRYPVQHATAQFHLGVVLTNAGRFDEAVRAFELSATLFDPVHLPIEHAKACNSLGAALRAAGRFGDAAERFRQAARLFRENGLPLEEGAALYNLALVQREVGKNDDAARTLRAARALLAEDRAPLQAAACERELGATLLALGRIEEAGPSLRSALALAEKTGDAAARGAAANALGLVHLAGGSIADAIAAFKDAAAANPRAVRAAGYAMAKANLALAYERRRDLPRARLAARQALSAPDVPEAVRTQADDVLDRLGARFGDLVTVLDDEPPETRPAVVREELARWSAQGDDARHKETAAWVGGQVARPGGTELAQALLGGLLELPPDAMERIITSLLASTHELDQEQLARLKSQFASAMVRFHPPQWIRLKDTFNRIARELGAEERWG